LRLLLLLLLLLLLGGRSGGARMREEVVLKIEPRVGRITGIDGVQLEGISVVPKAAACTANRRMRNGPQRTISQEVILL
jgi:hypothetical protein